MPGSATTNVEMTCLQGLADLERMEGPWLKEMAIGDPETVAITLRLLLAHMVSMSTRLMGAMVLDRLDAGVRATAFEAAGCNESAPTPLKLGHYRHFWEHPRAPTESIRGLSRFQQLADPFR